VSKFNTIKELFGFLHREKKWWLFPLIGMLVVLAFLIIFAQSSSLAPFLYPFF